MTMIEIKDDRVFIATEASADDWFYRLRRRLRVLAAAARAYPQSKDEFEALSAEIEDVIEMLPSEQQVQIRTV